MDFSKPLAFMSSTPRRISLVVSPNLALSPLEAAHFPVLCTDIFPRIPTSGSIFISLESRMIVSNSEKLSTTIMILRPIFRPSRARRM